MEENKVEVLDEENKTPVVEEKKEVQEIKSEAAPIQPKKKGNGGLIVIIVLLLAVCIGLGGFVFINKDKLFSSNEPKETKEKKETKKEEKAPVVTNYEVTDGRVADLIENLLRVGLYKSHCRIVEFYANDKKVTPNDIENLMAYHLAEGAAAHGQGSFSLDDMNKAIHKLLGKDYQFDPTSIDYKGQSCPSFTYESETKMFVKQPTACGGTCGPATSYKMVKVVDTDGILRIDVKVIFVSLDEGKDGIYSDYAKTNKIGTLEEDREPLYSKGADYQFTFKLEDGNYVFVSSEPIK